MHTNTQDPSLNDLIHSFWWFITFSINFLEFKPPSFSTSHPRRVLIKSSQWCCKTPERYCLTAHRKGVIKVILQVCEFNLTDITWKKSTCHQSVCTCSAAAIYILCPNRIRWRYKDEWLSNLVQQCYLKQIARWYKEFLPKRLLASVDEDC